MSFTHFNHGHYSHTLYIMNTYVHMHETGALPLIFQCGIAFDLYCLSITSHSRKQVDLLTIKVSLLTGMRQS